MSLSPRSSLLDNIFRIFIKVKYRNIFVQNFYQYCKTDHLWTVNKSPIKGQLVCKMINPILQTLRKLMRLLEQLTKKILLSRTISRYYFSKEILQCRKLLTRFSRKQAQNARFLWLNTSVLGLFSRKRGSINSGTGLSILKEERNILHLTTLPGT